MSDDIVYRERTEPKLTVVLPPTINRLRDIDMDVYLESRRLDPKLARANEWYPSTDAGDRWPRMVMPATYMRHTVADAVSPFWQARLLGDSEPTFSIPRYQSPRLVRNGAVILVYPWSNVDHHDISPGKTLVIVEGPCDALAAAGAGFTGCALMGISPNQPVLEHLRSQDGQVVERLVGVQTRERYQQAVDAAAA